MSTAVGSIHYDLGLNTSKFDAAASGLKSKINGLVSADHSKVIGIVEKGRIGLVACIVRAMD